MLALTRPVAGTVVTIVTVVNSSNLVTVAGIIPTTSPDAMHYTVRRTISCVISYTIHNKFLYFLYNPMNNANP